MPHIVTSSLALSSKLWLVILGKIIIVMPASHMLILPVSLIVVALHLLLVALGPHIITPSVWRSLIAVVPSLPHIVMMVVHVSSLHTTTIHLFVVHLMAAMLHVIRIVGVFLRISYCF